MSYVDKARNTVAILLLFAFCPLWSAPLFAASSDSVSNLPACCRRNGKHHCMMRMMRERELSRQPGRHLSAPFEKCPFFPKGLLPAKTQGHVVALLLGGMFCAGLLRHPACTAQVETQYRISFDHSRQKRGPPVSRRS